MEDSQIVAALSAQLAERIGRKRFDLWFTSQAQICVRGLALTIRTASSFVRDWLKAYFSDEIRACWAAMVGDAGTVEFDVDATLTTSTATNRRTNSESDSQQELKKRSPSVTASEAALAGPPGQRRNAGLAGFIVGPSNEYALRAAKLTASGRQQASPLVVCGPTGVGKTHLLRAIQHEYRRRHARRMAIYLTAEQFTTGYVEAVRGSGLPSFRQKCRGVDLLVIDDLQFFVGKRRTIEELLYTLDNLTADGRQIVLGSDRGLAELRGLGPEMVSRLAGGLICEISPPEFATRLEILQQLSDEAGIELSNEVATLLATQITAGARELRGAIHRLKAMSASYNAPISRALADQAVAELARHNTRAVRLADVQKVVCEAFGVEPAELRSDRKQRSIAEPRMLAMWLARKYTRSAWSEIGQYFGRASHSTVISAHNRVEKLIAQQGEIGMANQQCHVDEAIRRLEAALRTA